MADQDLLQQLVQINNTLKDIAGKSPYLIDGAVTGKSFTRLVVQADGTTLSTLTGVDGTNFLTLYNLSGKSLYKGAIITFPTGNPCKNVTAGAGQLFGYE